MQTYDKDGCSGILISVRYAHFNFGRCSDNLPVQKITRVDDSTVQLTTYKSWDAGCSSTQNGHNNIRKEIKVTSSPFCVGKYEYTMVTLPPGYATINYTRFTNTDCTREDKQQSVNTIVQTAGPACEPTRGGFRQRWCSSTNQLTEDFYSDPACTGKPFKSLVRGDCRQADGESIKWLTAVLCPTTTTSSTACTATSTSTYISSSTFTSTSAYESAKQSIAVATANQYRAQASLLVVTLLGILCA